LAACVCQGGNIQFRDHLAVATIGWLMMIDQIAFDYRRSIAKIKSM
jgi:hypothetical protein